MRKRLEKSGCRKTHCAGKLFQPNGLKGIDGRLPLSIGRSAGRADFPTHGFQIRAPNATTRRALSTAPDSLPDPTGLAVENPSEMRRKREMACGSDRFARSYQVGGAGAPEAGPEPYTGVRSLRPSSG